MPVTNPPDTIATPGELVVHTPPLTASVIRVVLPTHSSAVEGDIGKGVTSTVTILVAEQPAPLV
jgi:hypothetical protein